MPQLCFYFWLIMDFLIGRQHTNKLNDEIRIISTCWSIFLELRQNPSYIDLFNTLWYVSCFILETNLTSLLSEDIIYWHNLNYWKIWNLILSFHRFILFSQRKRWEICCHGNVLLLCLSVNIVVIYAHHTCPALWNQHHF